MSIYKKTIIISGIISLISLIVSLVTYHETLVFRWLNSISIGFFSSGILLFASSLIGYCREEKHLLHEYHWRISDLKYVAIELHTIPKDEPKYLEVTVEKINTEN